MCVNEDVTKRLIAKTQSYMNFWHSTGSVSRSLLCLKETVPPGWGLIYDLGTCGSARLSSLLLLIVNHRHHEWIKALILAECVCDWEGGIIHLCLDSFQGQKESPITTTAG